MNWLGFSLMALLLWGVWGFLSKVATNYLPSQAVYLLAITGHLAVIAYLLAEGKLQISWHPWGLAVALASGICMAVGLLSFLQALGRGPAVVVVPLTALYPAITVLLSGILLHEDLPPHRLIGVALALVAGWLLSR